MEVVADALGSERTATWPEVARGGSSTLAQQGIP